MDNLKQFETMAAIRAYARKLLTAPEDDLRPSTADYNYAKTVARMTELVKNLETRS